MGFFNKKVATVKTTKGWMLKVFHKNDEKDFNTHILIFSNKGEAIDCMDQLSRTNQYKNLETGNYLLLPVSKCVRMFIEEGEVIL